MRAWCLRQLDRFKTPAGPWVLMAAALLLVAMVPAIVHADIISWFWSVIAHIFLFFAKLLGYLLILLVKILIELAQYSNFVAPGPTAVQVGWVVVRDLVNMFFILVLLIMAFAIILGFSNYGSPQTVRDLFIMAIVINFSKTICGLFIDLGQVVMLTFVNGFAQAAGGNFLNAFQINKILQLENEGALDGSGLALAAALAFIMVAVATCVVLILTIQMGFRIVMLWILVILSPLAFFGRAFPPMKSSTYDRWWGMFKGYIIQGPTVAFFLWLALLTSQRSASAGGSIAKNEGFSVTTASDAEIAAQRSKNKIASEAASDDAILSMLIVTCILIGGMKISGEGQNIGAGMGSYLTGKAKGYAKSAGGFAKRQTIDRAVSAGKSTLRAGQGLALRGGGAGLQKLTGGRFGTGMRVQGQRIAAEQKKSRQDLKNKLMGSAEERLAATPQGRQGAAVAQNAKNEKNRLMSEARTPAQRADAIKKIDGDKNMRATRSDEEIGKQHAMLKEAAGQDANLKGAVGEFERKNWQKLPDLTDEERKKAVQSGTADDRRNWSRSDVAAAAQYMTSSQTKDMVTNGTDDQKNGLGDHVGKLGRQEQKKFLLDNNVAPKDIPKDWYKNEGVAEHALWKTGNDPDARAELMADPDKKAAMQLASTTHLNRTMEDPKATDRQKAFAAETAIKAGTLTADDIEANVELKGVLGKGLDVGSLAKGVDRSNGGQVAAAQSAMAAVMKADPERGKRLAKNDSYEHIMPSGGASGDGGAKAAADAAKAAAAAAKAAAEAASGLRSAGGGDFEMVGDGGSIELDVPQQEITTAVKEGMKEGAKEIKKTLDDAAKLAQRRNRAADDDKGKG
jgi:hypothetical protein